MTGVLHFVRLCALLVVFQALYDRYRGRLNAIPGPVSASMSNTWMVLAVYHNDMPRRNVAVHRKALYTKAAVQSLKPKINSCINLFTQNIIAQISHNNPARLDLSSWVHFFAFNCLGEINTSRKFGVLKSGRNINRMIKRSDQILIKTGLYAQAPIFQLWRRGMEVIEGQGKINPIMEYTSTIVRERLENPTSETDMLKNFIQLRKNQPDSLSEKEIIRALYINLMAGHDVLAVTLRAVLYYVARNPRVEKKLRHELAEFKKGRPACHGLHRW
ncbi:cytochrome P450 [Xylaria scruposa]|nr:cytochrome P450 [Xylaria scruposa]